MSLEQQNLGAANFKAECSRIINDHSKDLSQKTTQIGKLVERRYPGMGNQLLFTISSFLKKLLGISEETPKILYTGPERDYAVKILTEIFDVDIFIITAEQLRDQVLFEQRKQELNALIQSPSKRKILIINQDIDQSVFQ